MPEVGSSDRVALDDTMHAGKRGAERKGAIIAERRKRQSMHKVRVASHCARARGALALFQTSTS